MTFSADGSAPTAGADVGVVVVGETPYSEGFGDVGGPSCNFCTPQQLEPKSLTLNPADSATVDKVCAAIAKCVVLVVSGRPQVFDNSQADALVASWLPGSEGEGVADVLFGKKPFTGRLSQTWPANADQEPINVGDASYDPGLPVRVGAADGLAAGPAAGGPGRSARPTRLAGGAGRHRPTALPGSSGPATGSRTRPAWWRRWPGRPAT